MIDDGEGGSVVLGKKSVNQSIIHVGG